MLEFAQLTEWPTGKVCINPQEEVLADLSLETQVGLSFFYWVSRVLLLGLLPGCHLYRTCTVPYRYEYKLARVYLQAAGYGTIWHEDLLLTVQ